MTNLNRRIKHWMGEPPAPADMYERKFGSMFRWSHSIAWTMPSKSGPLTCTPETFEDFCKFFKRHFDVCPLSEQVSRRREGRAKRWHVVHHLR